MWTVGHFSKTQARNKDNKNNLGHDDVLTLFDKLILGFDDCLKEFQILDVAAVCLDAVDKVLDHALVYLTAQLEVVHEDVLHGDSF